MYPILGTFTLLYFYFEISLNYLPRYDEQIIDFSSKILFPTFLFAQGHSTFCQPPPPQPTNEYGFANENFHP